MRKPNVVDRLGSVARRLSRRTTRPSFLSHLRWHPRTTSWRPDIPRSWRPGIFRDPASRSTGRWVPAATLVFLAIAAVAGAPPGGAAGTEATAAAARAGSHGSRSKPTEGATAAAAPQAQAPKKAPAAPTKPAPPAKPKPVAWLNQAQMDNAAVIVKTGQKMRLPQRAYVIAVATAIQESRLLNLANPAAPQSLRLKSQGMGYDHDSVGLFQQRPASGWGSPAQLLNPEYAASRFYARLVQVPGWQNMALTWAAQSVQVSAFPYAYAKHEALAHQIVDVLTKK